METEHGPLLVTCPMKKCQYEWTPNAKKWKNHSTIRRTKQKLLFCPRCSAKIRLSVEDTHFLLTGRHLEEKPKKRKKYRRLRKHVKKRQVSSSI